MKRSTARILTTHTGSLPRPPQVVELMLEEQKHPGAKAAELATAVARARSPTWCASRSPAAST